MFDVVPLKQADDSEHICDPVSENLALEKIIRIKDDGSDFWIARYKKIPVGYAIGLVQDESHKSERIYVNPNYRERDWFGIKTSLNCICEKSQLR